VNLELVSKPVLEEENDESISASINIDDAGNVEKTYLLENVSTIIYWRM